MGLQKLLGELRDDLGRRIHATTFHSCRSGAAALSDHPSLAAVLSALEDQDPGTFHQRDELLRVLLSEHRRAAQTEPSSTWASALVVAFGPMLSALRRRVRGDAFAPEELDQLVLEGLLDALARCPLDARRLCQRLHLDTHRFVMRAVVAEQRRRTEQRRLTERAKDDSGFVVFEWRVRPNPLDEDERRELEQILRSVVADAVAKPRLDVVIATRLWDCPLEHFAQSSGPTGTRENQRIKRERTRMLAQLRQLLTSRLSPTDDDLALDLSRLRAAS